MTMTRRGLLGAGLAAAPLVLVPGMALARADTTKRFVMIILRGAMDGLNVVAPVGDPAYKPALVETGKMFDAGEVSDTKVSAGRRAAEGHL